MLEYNIFQIIFNIVIKLSLIQKIGDIYIRDKKNFIQNLPQSRCIDQISFFNLLQLIYSVLSPCAVQQSDPVIHTYIHTYIYICILFLTLSSIMFHHKCSEIVPWVIQQNFIAYPFQMQQFASTNPTLSVHPTPSPSPLATNLFSMSMSLFFSVDRSICDVYQIADISDIIQYLSFSF